MNLSLYGQVPSWYTAFRDAVFGQNISVKDAEQLFQEADRQARESLNSSALSAMLSRCEYLLGRVYLDHNRKDESVIHFEKGVNWAEKSLAESPNAEAYEMLAANIGQLCMIKSKAWVMANGLKVEENAKKALKLDSKNAGALYLIASRWAFGPGILGDPKRGITELKAILNGSATLQKDISFNVYSGLSYAYERLDQYQEALSWVQKALDIYPTNKFALGLQSQIQQELQTAK